MNEISRSCKRCRFCASTKTPRELLRDRLSVTCTFGSLCATSAEEEFQRAGIFLDKFYISAPSRASVWRKFIAPEGTVAGTEGNNRRRDLWNFRLILALFEPPASLSSIDNSPLVAECLYPAIIDVFIKLSVGKR